MSKTVNFERAKYLATLVLHCTSLAELYLKDYESDLRKQGYESRQMAKKMILDNARQAKSLRLQLKSLENMLTDKISEQQEDNFLADVGFLHNMLLLLIDRCGDNEEKRIKAKAMIFNMKSELNML